MKVRRVMLRSRWPKTTMTKVTTSNLSRPRTSSPADDARAERTLTSRKPPRGSRLMRWMKMTMTMRTSSPTTTTTTRCTDLSEYLLDSENTRIFRIGRSTRIFKTAQGYWGLSHLIEAYVSDTVAYPRDWTKQ